jgi:hypothetical protein
MRPELALGGKSRRCNNFGNYGWCKRRGERVDVMPGFDPKQADITATVWIDYVRRAGSSNVPLGTPAGCVRFLKAQHRQRAHICADRAYRCPRPRIGYSGLLIKPDQCLPDRGGPISTVKSA